MSYVRCVHEHIGSTGTKTKLYALESGIYSVVNGTSTLLYSDYGITDSNWKATNFNGSSYFFQRGHHPLVYDGTSINRVSNTSTYSGSIQQANEVLAGFGRLWNLDTPTDSTTLQWSDTLIGAAYSGGASGTLNLLSVFPKGVNKGVALAVFNNNLVIFCDKAILIYSGADDPSTMALSDTIYGVGCISRDSVVDVGTDIFFLSDTGLRSLGRVVQERSSPIFDIGYTVRDDLIRDVATHNANDNIKAVMAPSDGFYLLSLPGLKKSYCFDLKKRLENNVCRATVWTIGPSALATTRDKEVLFGMWENVGKYDGYIDNGKPYQFRYDSAYLNGDEKLQDKVKVWKQCRAVVYGGAGYSVGLNWGFNYGDFERGKTATIEAFPTPAEYNDGEYGISQYGYRPQFTKPLSFTIGGTGKVLQLQIRVLINGEPLALQELTPFAKLARTQLR